MQITIGIIIKPHGIKGVLKVKPITSNPRRFSALRDVFIENKLFSITKVEYAREFVLLYLKDIQTSEQAEELRGKEIKIDRKDAIVEEGAYLIVDLIGSEIQTEDGRILGKIYDINSFGTADVVSCKGEGTKNFHFPHLEWVVKKIDTKDKKLVVCEKEFLQVVSYE